MSSLRFPAPILFFALFQHSVFAQENGLLPQEPVPLPVEMIQPVPLPEIAYGDLAVDQTLPDNLKIDNRGGTIEGNLEDGLRLGRAGKGNRRQWSGDFLKPRKRGSQDEIRHLRG